MILCCLGLSLQATTAQEVTGRVVSKERTPLENVHVLLYSNQDSTLLTMAVTDSLGRYAMRLPEKAFSVTYSLIGAKQVTIPYDATLAAYQEVIMEEDDTALGEVVVLAHQVRTKPVVGGIECRILNQNLISNRTAVELHLPSRCLIDECRAERLLPPFSADHLSTQTPLEPHIVVLDDKVNDCCTFTDAILWRGLIKDFHRFDLAC